MKWLLILTIVSMGTHHSGLKPAIDTQMKTLSSLQECNAVAKTHQRAVESAKLGSLADGYKVIYSCTEIKESN